MQALRLRCVLAGLAAPLLVAVAGCGPASSINPYALRRENAQLKVAVRQYQDQLAQAKIQLENLDKDNEELHNLYAQEREAGRRVSADPEGIAAAPLRSAPPLATRSWDDEKDFGPARGRPAGAGKAVAVNKKGATDGWLAMTSVSGAEVLRDGDTIRIRVTNTSLFDPGKATLKPGATKVLDRVADAIRRDYPGQLVGIEGHTDSDPIRKSHWKDNHELSVQRAMAVYEYMRNKTGVRTDRMFVAGYGPNVPIASNKTTSGKSRNRRVEFVVHPNDAHAGEQARR